MIEKKAKILEAADKSGEKGQITKDCKISTSTVSTILKNRNEIKKFFKQKKELQRRMEWLYIPI